MQIHPDLARLRCSDSPQPGLEAALAVWRSLPEMAALTAALARFAEGAALADVPALAQVLTDPAAARALADGFVTPLAAAQRAAPLALLPLGHASGPGMARLRLAAEGCAALNLVAFARGERPAAASVLFDDCAVHEIVVAGAGRAALHRWEAGRLTSTAAALNPGTQFARHGPDAARQITAVSQPLLLLQLTREPAHPQPSREIALGDGRLLKTISGCQRTSQQLMALGVLGALRHRPALATLAALTQDRAAARELRWEALRQCLALDAARGLPLLAALAGDPADPLAAPAASLQAQLRATRPELFPLIPEPA